VHNFTSAWFEGRVWRGLLLAALLLGVALAPRAWDVDRMLGAARKLGPRAVDGAQALRGLVAQAAGVEEEQRLALVNQFFNRRVLFHEDTEVWGQVDYWASPLKR
jgi:predicted transglutaminase-like cysteine proteinase